MSRYPECAKPGQAEWRQLPHCDSSVSWSCPTELISDSIANPPHFHGSLFCADVRSGRNLSPALENDLELEEEDVTLSPDLLGVKAAQETIMSYEVEEGFYELLEEEDGASAVRCEFNSELDGNENPKLDDLSKDAAMGPPPYPGHDDALFPLSSPPIYPSGKLSSKKTAASYANAVVKNLPSSRRSLNAAASSFVPQIHIAAFPSSSSTSGSTPSPTAASFSFPSMDLKSPSPVTFKKDGDGFYTEVNVKASDPAPTRRSSSTLLPPFLGETIRQRKVSRTRSIVDSIRSAEQAATAVRATSLLPNTPSSTLSSPEFNFFQPRHSASEDVDSPPTSPEGQEHDEEGDGWIRAERLEKEVKAKRTRELFTALSRHRAESFDQFSGVKLAENRPSSVQPSLPKSLPANDPVDCQDNADGEDGWVRAPATHPQPRQTAYSCATPPVPGSFIPMGCTPFGVGSVPYNAAVLVQMQLQMQMHLLQARAVLPALTGYHPVPPALSNASFRAGSNGYTRVRQMSESGLAPPNLRRNRWQ